jgi:hypothetical protein
MLQVAGALHHALHDVFNSPGGSVSGVRSRADVDDSGGVLDGSGDSSPNSVPAALAVAAVRLACEGVAGASDAAVSAMNSVCG